MNVPSSNRETVTTIIMQPPAVKHAALSSRTRMMPTVSMETEELVVQNLHQKSVICPLDTAVDPVLVIDQNLKPPNEFKPLQLERPSP